MLDDPKIDAVSVLTPNFTHTEISIAALRAGKHVLCEKPMVITLIDCEKMTETARQTGKKLMIGQNQRLAAAHIKAKTLLDSGAIGDVITFFVPAFPTQARTTGALTGSTPGSWIKAAVTLARWPISGYIRRI